MIIDDEFDNDDDDDDDDDDTKLPTISIFSNAWCTASSWPSFRLHSSPL